MGAIGGLFGLSGGASGTGFNAGYADLMPSAHPDQANLVYNQQQELLRAMQAQGGFQNQTDVYNQLKGIAAGQGPNPAQAMLNQQTGANVANQAALMAGQRGASANTGLLARQAAMQGGALQQQAVGQGATMQANQSMAALNAMGGLANTQVANQIGTTNALQQNVLNAIAAQNQARVSNQSGVNALAQTKMQGQEALIGGMMGGYASGMASQGGGAAGAAMASDENLKKDISSGDEDVEKFLSKMSANKYKYKEEAGIDNAEHVSPMAQELEASPVGDQMVFEGDKGKMIDYSQAGPAILSSLAYLYKELKRVNGDKQVKASSKGGEIKNYDNGGMIPNPLMSQPAVMPQVASGPESSFGRFLQSKEVAPSGNIDIQQPLGGGDEQLKGASSALGSSLANIKSSPEVTGQTRGGYGGANLGVNTQLQKPQMPRQMQPAPTAKDIRSYSIPFKSGGLVPVMVSPGEKIIPPEKVQKAAGGKVEAKTVPGKAKVPGDSIKNDTVKTELKPGTVVVPRTKSGNEKDSASFVRNVLAKRGRK